MQVWVSDYLEKFPPNHKLLTLNKKVNPNIEEQSAGNVIMPDFPEQWFLT